MILASPVCPSVLCSSRIQSRQSPDTWAAVTPITSPGSATRFEHGEDEVAEITVLDRRVDELSLLGSENAIPFSLWRLLDALERTLGKQLGLSRRQLNIRLTAMMALRRAPFQLLCSSSHFVKDSGGKVDADGWEAVAKWDDEVAVVFCLSRIWKNAPFGLA